MSTKQNTVQTSAGVAQQNGQALKVTEPQSIETYVRHLFFDNTEDFMLSRFTPPDEKHPEGTISYHRQKGQPTDKQLRIHLSGEAGVSVLASYPFRGKDKVRWMCFDSDSKDLEKAKNIIEDVHGYLGDIPHSIEFSGSKGYHAWSFFEEDLDSELVYKVCSILRELTGAAKDGDPHLEIYPKQKIADSTGNGVKVPLCHHPKPSKGKSYFVDPNDEWTITPPTPELTKRVTKAQLEGLLERLQEELSQRNTEPKTPEEAKNELVILLKPFWSDGQRHNLALCLAGTLFTAGWTKADVDDLVTTLTGEGGGDLSNVLECVTDTLQKLINGKPIQGLEALGQILPMSSIRTLMELAGVAATSTIIPIIDRIRLRKGPPPFAKVRLVTATVLSYLRERGRFVMTPEPENKKFWYEHDTHKLYNCTLPEWDGVLYRVGMNLKESFYSQVCFALDQEIETIADRAKVYHKSHWDGEALWVNFGSVEVYRLDGKTIALTYNGADDVLFDSEEHITAFDGLDLCSVPAISPWTLLTQNINFVKKDKVTQAEAGQQEHMLRALIISMCFKELHPTKPLSLFLGPRGSGKTSACRRILKFFVGMNAEVLSLVDDKPDSLRASLEDRLYLPFDNLEECKARWFPAMLSKLATGVSIELRELHKTNKRYIIRPDAFVSLSAIEIPDIFSNAEGDAVASRLLPFQIDALLDPQSEKFLQDLLAKNHSAMWAGMLDILNRCVASLNAHVEDQNKTAEIRLADFENFCYRLRDLPDEFLSFKLVHSGIRNLITKQNEVMGAISPFILALQAWIDGWNDTRLHDHNLDPYAWRTASNLFNILKPIAKNLGHEDKWRWKNGQGLAKHIESLEGLLQRTFGLEVQRVESGEGKDADGNPRMRKEYRVKPL